MSQTPTSPLQVAAIGEILWDVFDTGPRFGGAPANFAGSFAKLSGASAQTWMLSAVGNDELGSRAIERLRAQGVDTNWVTQIDCPTGQVFIQLNEAGSAEYEFLDQVAWDQLETRPGLLILAMDLDAICFGSLGQRSPQSEKTIQAVVSATPSSALRVFDVNLRPPFVDSQIVERSLQIANTLKLNDDELPVLANWFSLSGSPIEQLRAIAERFTLDTVALTRGDQGSIVVQGGAVSEHGGVATEVIDTVGAGDAFTARLVLGLLRGESLDELNQAANELAARVCATAGADWAV